MRFKKLKYLLAIGMTTIIGNKGFCQIIDTVSPRYTVTLREAHMGTLEIDTMLLNSYEALPSNIRQFYLDSRSAFVENKIDFTNDKIIKAASDHDIPLMSGPMLGDIKENGVSIWLRPSNKMPIHLRVMAPNSTKAKVYTLKPVAAGKDHRIVLNDLNPSTKYTYELISQDTKIAKGAFRTTPKNDKNEPLRIVFGSGFHKIGLHNPNIINSILQREPTAMVLLGDIAVDDRDNNMSMHRSDYLLRDVAQPWKNLSANIAIYASWDDHDYLNNDLSGLPKGVTKEDRDELRDLWRQNWNNPQNEADGIYFNTRIGQVEIIMLDTRSYRNIENRGEYDSYLGKEQLSWLKKVLANSTAPFKVISSGTMWSDYISNGKDSWGTWDTLGREEIYNFIETENIPGVLLISGDRHGARGFTIPRDSGFEFYEFGPASLGGVPGPNAIAEDPSHQLFGYKGLGLKAFGEFTFDIKGSEPQVTFRLIDESGNIMEEHTLPYTKLTPPKP